MKIEFILTALAAELSAGNLTDITELARRAGLPYQTVLRLALAGDYGAQPDIPLQERLDLFDLVWAANCVLNGFWPAHRVRVHRFCVRYHFELISYRNNAANPDSFPVVAELHTRTRPGQLHLCLREDLQSLPNLKNEPGRKPGPERK